MPELPEVEGLARVLRARCVGRTVTGAVLLAFMCLKTTAWPVSSLVGEQVSEVERHGKFLGVRVGGIWLVIHLAHAGWIVWRDSLPAAPPRRGPLALRLVFDDDTSLDVTEAGTRKNLSLYLVADLSEVPGLAGLGIEPLDEAFTPERLDEILTAAGAAHLKGVLRDQRLIAGIGNAYSDEIIWAARLSPFAACSRLGTTQRMELYAAIRDVLSAAVDDLSGRETGDLKPHKKAGFAVHGRTGEPCPRCGATIAEVSFADSSLQYCPVCQTGGHRLADRRMSRLLK